MVGTDQDLVNAERMKQIEELSHLRDSPWYKKRCDCV